MPPSRFGNAAVLLLASGMDADAVGELRSHTLCEALGVSTPPLRGHDALSDARSVAYTLQHLLRTGSLRAAHFGGS